MAAVAEQQRRAPRPGQDAERLIWTPNPGPQRFLLTCPIDDILFGGSRGGGKTDGLAGDFIAHWNLWGQHARGILFRRSYDELEEVMGRLFEIMYPLGARWRAGSKTWYMPGGGPSGGFLKLRYLERDHDAARYQGHEYTWLGGDEVGNFPTPAPIDKMRGTMRSRHGVRCVMRLTANPGGVGHQWIYDRYIEPSDPFIPYTDPETGITRVYIPSRLSDNPALAEADPEYVQRLRGVGPPWLVQAWLEGDWNATPEGGVFKSEWFRYYDGNLPPDAYLLVSVDTATKPGEINDYTAITVWAVSKLGFFLVDAWRGKVDYPAQKRRVEEFGQTYRPTAVLIEDKGTGSALIQEMRNTSDLSIIPIEPVGDKVSRAQAVTPIYEAGRVFHPTGVPWKQAYEIELTLFPEGAYDDWVDSTTQALKYANRHGARDSWELYSSGGHRRPSADAEL